MFDYRNQDRADKNDPWFLSDGKSVWDGHRWVDPPVIKKTPGVNLRETDVKYHHPQYGAVKSWLVQQQGLTENINVRHLDPKKYPTLSFDSHNHVTLFDDLEVHKKFGVSSQYTAVTDQLGHLHTMYQASRVVPKFQSAQSVGLSKHIPQAMAIKTI